MFSFNERSLNNSRILSCSKSQPYSIPKNNYSIQEIFEAIPKLKDNPLVQRVVEVFDEDQSGGVDFKEFVLGNIYLNTSSQHQNCRIPIICNS